MGSNDGAGADAATAGAAQDFTVGEERDNTQELEEKVLEEMRKDELKLQTQKQQVQDEVISEE